MAQLSKRIRASLPSAKTRMPHHADLINSVKCLFSWAWWPCRSPRCCCCHRFFAILKIFGRVNCHRLMHEYSCQMKAAPPSAHRRHLYVSIDTSAHQMGCARRRAGRKPERLFRLPSALSTGPFSGPFDPFRDCSSPGWSWPKRPNSIRFACGL